jgi:hypothetical protein
VDLGLAWGAQVDWLLRSYTFYQDARWLFWRSDGPMSDQERTYVTTHTGNVHTIPAEGNNRIYGALRPARKGDHVTLDGSLVEIQDAGTNVLARSSTRRWDRGAGRARSCRWSRSRSTTGCTGVGAALVREKAHRHSRVRAHPALT